MRFITIITLAIVASVSFGIGVSAAATPVPPIGSCRAEGDYATCDASGTANHPGTIRVHVSAVPGQNVLVTWTMTCSQGFGAGGKSGQFNARTTVNRVISHPYKHPDSCIVSVGAQLSGSGSLHVWLTG